MPAAARSFEAVWPDVADQLHSMMAAKRLPLAKREDLVQETGLRLFKMWDRVDPERPVWPLAVTILLNLIRDEARRRPEREVLGAVPDAPADLDVERTSLARLEFARVFRAMGQLSPAHRSILMTEIGQGDDPRSTVAASKMMRLRARRKLNAALEGASASALALFGRSRTALEGALHAALSRNPFSGTEVAPAVAAAIAVLTLGSSGLALPGLEDAPDRDRIISVNVAEGISGAAAGGGIASRSLERVAAITGERDGQRSGGTRKGARRPSDAGEPDTDVVVPIPAGGFISVKATVEAAGYGIALGRRPSGAPPVCVVGLEDRSVGNSLGCGYGGSGSTRAKATAKVTVGGHTVEVDEDHGTGV